MNTQDRLSKQDLVYMMKNNGTKIVEQMGIYTLNGRKLHKSSAENAIGDLGKYVESACQIETEGNKTIYSYRFYKARKEA